MRRRSSALIALLSLTAASPGASRVWAGETACWFENGAIVAPAAIADMAGDYVIDLSAPNTLLHETKAQMSGYAQTDLTLPVRLAGQRVAAAPVIVKDLDYRGVGFVTPIAGVIGADILDLYVVSIDFEPCRLRLDPLGERFLGRGRPLTVTMVNGVPTVQAAASSGDRGLSGAFALDTASNGGVRARGAADAPRQKPAGALRGLSWNGQLLQNLPAVAAGDLPQGVVGALGVQVLSAYRLRLDPAAGRLWLTPAPKEKGPGVSARP
jgi:hypothetical protein